MPTTEINRVIEGFHLLSLDEKEDVADMINKQFIDYRREQIFQQANDARNDLKQGNVKSGSFQELYKDLDGSVL